MNFRNIKKKKLLEGDHDSIDLILVGRIIPNVEIEIIRTCKNTLEKFVKKHKLFLNIHDGAKNQRA